MQYELIMSAMGNCMNVFAGSKNLELISNNPFLCLFFIIKCISVLVGQEPIFMFPYNLNYLKLKAHFRIHLLLYIVIINNN